MPLCGSGHRKRCLFSPDDHSNNTAGSGMPLAHTFRAACLEFHAQDFVRELCIADCSNAVFWRCYPIFKLGLYAHSFLLKFLGSCRNLEEGPVRTGLLSAEGSSVGKKPN